MWPPPSPDAPLPGGAAPWVLNSYKVRYLGSERPEMPIFIKKLLDSDLRTGKVSSDTDSERIRFTRKNGKRLILPDEDVP
jgi:hypothetical protein